MTPFSVIVFGVVVWKIAVSGAKQFRFRLKTVKCGRGLNQTPDWYPCLDAIVYIRTQMFKYIVVIQDSAQGLSLFHIIK